ncbi:hypothetical protein F4803DRAFT_508366 [Xylaria telfairii]|nr:hypothetical protein F4803DRAFT_508366 [Xylaria telfairii]
MALPMGTALVAIPGLPLSQSRLDVTSGSIITTHMSVPIINNTCEVIMYNGRCCTMDDEALCEKIAQFDYVEFKVPPEIRSQITCEHESFHMCSGHAEEDSRAEKNQPPTYSDIVITAVILLIVCLIFGISASVERLEPVGSGEYLNEKF